MGVDYMNYVLKNANIFDGKNNENIQKNMMVIIEDGKIKDIKQSNDDIGEDYKVIDLKGQYLLPGLINLHAHLFGTGKPSKVLGGGSGQKLLVKFVNTSLGKPVIDSLVKKHVTSALNSGVTTIRSSGDFCFSDVRVRDKINSGEIIGPRLIVPGPAITCVGGHGDGTFAVSNDDPNTLTEYVKSHKDKGVDYIKICVTGGVMDAKKKGEPGEVKMTLEQTKAVCDMAHRLGLKVASHTESSKGIYVALAGGVDTVEHGSFLDENLVQKFKENNSAFIVTTSPALPLAKLSPNITKLNEMCVYNSNVILDGMVKGAKEALKNNIPVGLGTDASCPLVTPYDMWREVYYFAEFYGVSNAFAIHTATLKNAQILGIDDITGSIEVGKQADLIVVKENPLENIKSLRKVNMVMVGGKLIESPKYERHEQIDEWLDSLSTQGVNACL